jgi:NADPH-dependent 2,4-dienoyl-CoA reductase/sulfur reductase-like enzyme
VKIRIVVLGAGFGGLELATTLSEELGDHRVARVDVDFLSGPRPTGTFQEPSSALIAEKQMFGSHRRARWFGL